MVIFSSIAYRSVINFLVLRGSTQMRKQQIINAICQIIVAAIFGILLVLVIAYFWQQNNENMFYDKSVSVKSVRMAA